MPSAGKVHELPAAGHSARNATQLILKMVEGPGWARCRPSTDDLNLGVGWAACLPGHGSFQDGHHKGLRTEGGPTGRQMPGGRASTGRIAVFGMVVNGWRGSCMQVRRLDDRRSCVIATTGGTHVRRARSTRTGHVASVTVCSSMPPGSLINGNVDLLEKLRPVPFRRVCAGIQPCSLLRRAPSASAVSATPSACAMAGPVWVGPLESFRSGMPS